MSYTLLSKHRNEIYGIAALMIVIVHILEFGSWNSGMWYYAKRLIDTVFSLAVPVFSFLSGIGMYFSMKKGEKMNVYYKKRFERVFLPYLIIAGTYYLIKYIFISFQPLEFILQLSTIAYWTKHGSIWYIAMLVPVYGLVPFYSKWVESKHRTAKIIATFLALFIVASLLYLLNKDAYESYYLLIRTVGVFVAGYCVGKPVYEKNGDKKSVVCMTLIPLAIYGLSGIIYKVTGLYWGPELDFSYALVGITVAVFLSILMDCVSKYKAITFAKIPIERVGGGKFRKLYI